MKPCKVLFLMLMLATQAAASDGKAGVDAAPTAAMVASYWGYVAFLPLMIVAFAINGWLVRPKG